MHKRKIRLTVSTIKSKTSSNLNVNGMVFQLTNSSPSLLGPHVEIVGAPFYSRLANYSITMHLLLTSVTQTLKLT